MKRTKYKYSGPVSGATLADGRELMLLPGKMVELVAECEYTKTLLALGHLVPVAEGKAVTKPSNRGKK